MKDIHGWAKSKAVREMLKEVFSIKKLPCYSQFTNIVGIIDSNELNKIFMEFFCKLVDVAGKTISFDGKTVRSTGKMGNFDSPLHIASATDWRELRVTCNECERSSHAVHAINHTFTLVTRCRRERNNNRTAGNRREKQ